MRRAWVGVGVALSLHLVTAPQDAQACGGTFCDSVTSMPVAQTGESILFVRGDGWIETHIQIEYDPTAQATEFAWLVPVMAQPELSVGSANFFSALEMSTAPNYGFSARGQPCPNWGDDDGCDGSGDGGGVDEKLDIAGGGDGPNVVDHRVVGAFEMFVLDGGTPQGVMDWLGDNEFEQDPAAAPIIAEYLDEGFMFVAFKLANDAEASEIHPVVLRYAGEEPCVPIRLTRIAAVDDMVIRTYFLTEDRAVPTNYQHVELNPLKLDFLRSGANYAEVLSMAIDEAGGHAWVTEYAGDSRDVPMDDVPESSWELDGLVGLDASDTVRAVFEQGWVSCDWRECTWQSPLLEATLMRWLPAGPDFDFEALWQCPECETPLFDENPERWDSDGFLADLDERVVAPAKHGKDLLDAWPTLTRMVTTLSPREMTVDPLFHENPDLPDVINTQELGGFNLFCNGDVSFNLPDGRLLATPGGAWPDVAPSEMPWAARVETIAEAGAPQVVVDNHELIETLRKAFNVENNARTPLWLACGDDSEPSVEEDTGIGSAGADESRPVSCACTSGTTGGFAWLMLGLPLTFFGARRHRWTNR